MMNLTMRPYRGEANLVAIAHLINTCEAIDQLDQGLSISQLRSMLNTPSCNQARDVRLWEDADSQLIAFAHLWITEPSETIDGVLVFHVHPSARGGSVETQIIKWGEERMREVKQEQGIVVRLLANAREHHSDYRNTILKNQGFTTERYFLRMKRSLKEPIPKPQFPHGFTLCQVNPQQDAAALVELHNEAFIDHWNYHPLTQENLQHWLTEPTYKPELNLIALAIDGTFAACCHCDINDQENTRTGRNEGKVAILGTRRDFRRMGLGRAMLLAGMHQLKAAGVDTAKLGVDADNPNGALQLYKSVGFSQVFRRIAYVKEV